MGFLDARLVQDAPHALHDCGEAGGKAPTEEGGSSRYAIDRIMRERRERKKDGNKRADKMKERKAESEECISQQAMCIRFYGLYELNEHRVCWVEKRVC